MIHINTRHRARAFLTLTVMQTRRRTAQSPLMVNAELDRELKVVCATTINLLRTHSDDAASDELKLFIYSSLFSTLLPARQSVPTVGPSYARHAFRCIPSRRAHGQT